MGIEQGEEQAWYQGEGRINILVWKNIFSIVLGDGAIPRGPIISQFMHKLAAARIYIISHIM